MNNIIIKKINYYGENYFYESPTFIEGLNIITGDNATGKSTLSDLIYYSMGGNVKQFNSNEKSIHREIMSDKNNYVELFIEVNKEKFKFIRKFNSKECNIIIIGNLKTGKSESYYLNRKSNENIFSDWFIQKLGIPKLTLFQGSKSFVLGITDLMRLIYHHQLSDSHYIHKQPDGKSNFVNDSLDIRKTIFEVLTSEASIEYYDALNNLKEVKIKMDSKKNLYEALINTNEELSDDFSNTNRIFIEKEIGELKNKVNIYNQKLEKEEFSVSSSFNEDIKNIKKIILNLQEQKNELDSEIKLMRSELFDFYNLHDIQLNEIKNVERIILTGEYLGIFTPNECPVCSKKVERSENECLCGNNLNEEAYQNFFYTRKDHDKILSTKKVQLKTTEEAIDFIQEEINDKEVLSEKITDDLEKRRKKLIKMVSNTPTEQTFLRIRELNKKITITEKKINKNKLLLQMLNKTENQYKELQKLKKKYELSSIEKRRLEIGHNRKMLDIKEKFSKIYQDFLVSTNKEIQNAKIDNDYMPVINEGYYKNTASKVHRRFFYFVSLLSLSLEEEIPFPKFLLVDTPQNFGIDAADLKTIFTELQNFCVHNNDKKFQILLTIKEDFVNHLNKTKSIHKIENKLLSKRNDI